MFDGEDELVFLPSQVEIGIPPCMDFTGAPQGLTGTYVVSRFACVMHKDDGGLEQALEVSETGQERRDFTGGVFIDLVQADKRIENEQLGTDGLDRFSKAAPIRGIIETKRR